MRRVQLKLVLGVFALVALIGCVLAVVEKEPIYAIFGILGGLISALFILIAQAGKQNPFGQVTQILQKLDPPTRRKFGLLTGFVLFSPYLLFISLIAGVFLKWPGNILSFLSQAFLVTIILSRIGWLVLRRWMSKKFAEELGTSRNLE